MKPSIDPVLWSPPPVAPRFRPSAPLPPLELLPLPARGEDVAVDGEGRLVAGLEDGRIVRISRERGTPTVETLVNTCGRPLGIEVDVVGSLIVCDTKRGLLRIDPDTRRVETLVAPATHSLSFCNNAAIASDGTIYFSDSSRRFTLEHWRADLVEHSGTGRLLRRTPNGKVEVLLDGLQFANGVALASDESFVVVAETGAYRLTRVWLEGERQGKSDVLIDGLPGFPDNLANDERGLIWISLPSPRSRLLDFLHRSHPRWRSALWKLPDSLQPGPSRTMSVMAVNDEGQVVYEFAGRARGFHMATGLRVHGTTLYLASLEQAALAVTELPALAAAPSLDEVSALSEPPAAPLAAAAGAPGSTSGAAASPPSSG